MDVYRVPATREALSPRALSAAATAVGRGAAAPAGAQMLCVRDAHSLAWPTFCVLLSGAHISAFSPPVPPPTH